jgi:hypothetical protein
MAGQSERRPCVRHGMDAIPCIICTNDYVFVTYDDESVTRASRGEIESNVLAVFSRDRTFRIGLAELLLANRDKSSPIEINAAYTFDNTIVFVPYPDESVYLLDADNKTLTKLQEYNWNCFAKGGGIRST